MTNNDRINQIYENLNKKSIASASLYDHKIQRNDTLVRFTSEIKRSSDPGVGKKKINPPKK